MRPARESGRSLNLGKLQEVAKSGDQEWKVYLAAKEYVAAGFYVLPLNGKLLPKRKYNVNYGHASRKPSTIEKWFHPTDGQFAGWNIGIATGMSDGVFAVDVDRHGDKDGFITLKRLTDKHGHLPPGPVQCTPNGGKHYLYLWQENCIGSTGKIGDGIDTRGGAEHQCKGHIVVFPSIVDGRMYTWESGGEVPEVPPWLMERMGVAWKPRAPKGGGRGNENVDDSDIERQIPLEQVQRMLEAIDPDELTYDEWLRVGQAIHSQHPGDDGLDTWDRWSSQGKRYKRGECSIRWSGFDVAGPIRMGSLFYYAKEAGWSPEPGDTKGSRFDELVEEMNQEFGVIAVGGKIRILREFKEVDDPMLGHFDLLGLNDFKALMANDIVFITDGNGEEKPVPRHKIWLGHEGRRTYPRGLGLFPDGDRAGYYNTWNGWAISPAPGDCSLFMSHIKDIICSGNEEHYTWVLDWIADAFQDPANPKGTAVVMRGDEGIGKGTLANTLGEIYGTHYRHLIDDAHLTGNFNAHMMDALFVFADEITWGGNKKTDGKLKGLVTEEYLIGERKGVDAIPYRSMVRVMIASNNSWVVPAGTNSRRWMVLDVSDERASDRAYFDAIKAELNNGGREAFLYEMLNREVTSNLRVPIVTKALEEQRVMSLFQTGNSSLLQWWIDCLEHRIIDAPDEGEWSTEEDSDWPSVVAKPNLYKAYKEWAQINRMPVHSMMIFYRDIKIYGFKDYRPKASGSRKRMFKVPSVETARAIVESKYHIDLKDDDHD